MTCIRTLTALCAVSSVVLFMTGCGGGSSSSKKVGIDLTFEAGIRGAEAEPSMSEYNVDDGDIVYLNSRVSGTIASVPDTVTDASVVSLSFNPTVSGEVLVILTSTAPDVDLAVSYDTLLLGSPTEESQQAGSYEVLLLDIRDTREYTIDISTIGDGGSFELTLVEANRETLGLADDEYFVTYQKWGTVLCDGKADEGIIENSHSIINWKDGTVNYDDQTLKFSSVDGYEFSVDNALSLGSITETLSLVVDVDPETGDVDGSIDLLRNYSTGDYAQCKTAIDIRKGKVRL
jgi:hypothetical protein